jgi:hypothetical protein
MRSGRVNRVFIKNRIFVGKSIKITICNIMSKQILSKLRDADEQRHAELRNQHQRMMVENGQPKFLSWLFTRCMSRL